MTFQNEPKATKRVIAYQLAESMKEKSVTKTEMAKCMGTSWSSLNRLLDPLNTSVSLAPQRVRWWLWVSG